MFLMAELICVVFHETHDKAPQGHIPFFWTLLHTVHLVVRAQQLIFLFTFVSQATTAPTALMCARWTPASTSRDAPGSRASLAVTRVTVPATTSANTARKSKCFPHICKTVNVLYVLIDQSFVNFQVAKYQEYQLSQQFEQSLWKCLALDQSVALDLLEVIFNLKALSIQHSSRWKLACRSLFFTKHIHFI